MATKNHKGQPGSSGQMAAQAMMAELGTRGFAYSSHVVSNQEAWHTLTSLFRPLPIPEQIGFLNAIYSNFRAEYDRQFAEAEAQARGEDRPGPRAATFWMSNREAHALMLRVKTVLDLLAGCGEIPDYTYAELMAKLDTMKVDERRRYAGALLAYFPGRALEDWADVFGTPEAAAASRFSQWPGFHWDQLRAYVNTIDRNYNELLRQEVEAAASANAADATRRQTRRIKVASSDTDVVRIAEALKAASIIDPATTGPQIVAAFEWLGVMNEKPGNYDAFKNQLDRPPSPEVMALIKALLADAGDDVKGEIIAFLRRR